MAKIVGLQARVPESVRDTDLKKLKRDVQALIPSHVKKPSQDDLVGILIVQARAATVTKGVKAYLDLKGR